MHVKPFSTIHYVVYINPKELASSMELPKLLYMQKVKVYIPMVEIYQQFIRKLISASKALKIQKSWTVYEEPFSKVKETQTFVFIRSLESWQELDLLADEEPLSQIFRDIYGEKDAFEWLTIAQKAVKSTKTQIMSTIPSLSYNLQDS